MSVRALLDSNVIVAALLSGHAHHEPSFRLIAEWRGQKPAVAAHSLAETYNTLTRPRADVRLIRTPEEAVAQLENLRPLIDLLGLTPSQVFDGIRGYAGQRGVGPRLYDKLIGDVAVVHGISTIVTWNLGHMRNLFSSMTVMDPIDFERSKA